MLFLQNNDITINERKQIDIEISTFREPENHNETEKIDEFVQIENVTEMQQCIYDRQKDSLRSSEIDLNDVNNNDIDSQIILEADFYTKAFPMRVFPSYVVDTLSPNSKR